MDSENALTFTRELFQWLISAQPIIAIIQALFVAIFLGLLAPLIAVFRRGEIERHRAGDFKLYNELIDLKKSKVEASKHIDLLIENSRIFKKFSSYTKFEQSLQPTPPNKWDTMWSLFIPLVSALAMLFFVYLMIAENANIPLVWFAFVIGISISTFFSFKAGRWVAIRFPREVLQHFLQASFSLVFSAIGTCVFLFLAFFSTT